MHRALAVAVLLGVSLAANVSRATPTARLVYSRAGDANACPDEPSLRRAVAARVGYDPFFAWAARTIVASLTRRDSLFVATVDLVDEHGISHGARELHTAGDCGELLDAVALAIAIAIDPTSLSRPTMPPPTAPVSPPPEDERAAKPDDQQVPSMGAVSEGELPHRTPPSVSTPPSRPVSFETGAGAVASTGVAPHPALGLGLGVAMRWSAFSLGLEGRIDAPTSTSARGGGDVSSWLVLGEIAPCAHVGPVLGCALVQVGSAQTAGSGLLNTRSESAPWWATGGRFGVRFPLAGDALLRVHTDVVANLDRMTLVLNGSEAWKAPPIAGSLGADVVFHFP